MYYAHKALLWGAPFIVKMQTELLNTELCWGIYGCFLYNYVKTRSNPCLSMVHREAVFEQFANMRITEDLE